MRPDDPVRAFVGLGGKYRPGQWLAVRLEIEIEVDVDVPGLQFLLAAESFFPVSHHAYSLVTNGTEDLARRT